MSEPNPIPTVQAEAAVVGEAVALQVVAQVIGDMKHAGSWDTPTLDRVSEIVDQISRDARHTGEYTAEIGQAGQSYMQTFGEFEPRLPGTFRWSELWDAMRQAPVSTGEQPGMSEGDIADLIRPHLKAVQLSPWDVTSSYEVSGVYDAARAILERLAKNQNCKRGGDEPQANAPSITIPDDLLSLSEAATQGEWFADDGAIWFDSRREIMNAQGFPDVDGGQEQLASSNPTDAAFIVASVNFIRTLAAKQGGKS